MLGMREMLEMLNIFEILLKNPSATVELKLWIFEEKKPLRLMLRILDGC